MKASPLIDLSSFLHGHPVLHKTLTPLFIRPAEHLLMVDRLNDTYEGFKVREKFSPEENFFDNVLTELDTEVRITSGTLESIPETGPVFVVSNHPFGAIDGIILGSLLNQRRADSKILANSLLSWIPEIRPYLFTVNPFGTRKAVRENLKGMRAAGEWLADGHCLATFPSGFVSYHQPEHGEVRDADWHSNVARLARKHHATVVPIWFEGTNGAASQALGRIHPRLRTLNLVREVFNPERKAVELKIGSPIPPHKFAAHESDASLARFFQMRSEVLRYRKRYQTTIEPKSGEPIIERQPEKSLVDEIESLPDDCLLCTHGSFRVYSATGDQIPVILEEIGRTRELTFRSVGEGVGKSVDIDEYDHLYHHLFLWNHETSEIVGAYRIGLVNELVAKHGFEGLYSNKVIEYQSDAFDSLGKGGTLELGRSYIVPAYQRRGTSLFLLWRGIVKFVRKHPGYNKLFGTVSISDQYSPMSQSLLIAYMKKHAAEQGLDHKIRARKRSSFENLRGLENLLEAGALASTDITGGLIAEMEPDGKGFPVLLKHYLQLNGVILGVGVDSNFGEVLDGFILVDLDKIDPAVLQKYEGKS